MNERDRRAFPPQAIRDDFIPKEDYLSAEFARLEEEYLWPQVWQVACREEEIPLPGNITEGPRAEQNHRGGRPGPRASKDAGASGDRRELPRTASGKVMKHELRERAKAIAQSPG
jgi:hypothetical protein